MAVLAVGHPATSSEPAGADERRAAGSGAPEGARGALQASERRGGESVGVEAQAEALLASSTPGPGQLDDPEPDPPEAPRPRQPDPPPEPEDDALVPPTQAGPRQAATPEPPPDDLLAWATSAPELDEGHEVGAGASVDGLLARASAPDASRSRSLDPNAPIEAALAEDPPVVEPIVEAAERKVLEPELLVSLAWHESRFNPDAVSHAGAVGVLQVMPRTFEWIADELDESLDPRDAADNALAAAAYLDRLLDSHDDLAEALIAYNQGPAALEEHGPYPAAEKFASRVIDTRDQLRDVAWETAEP